MLMIWLKLSSVKQKNKQKKHLIYRCFFVLQSILSQLVCQVFTKCFARHNTRFCGFAKRKCSLYVRLFLFPSKAVRLPLWEPLLKSAKQIKLIGLPGILQRLCRFLLRCHQNTYFPWQGLLLLPKHLHL